MLVFSAANRWDDHAFERWRAAICDHFVPLRPEQSAPGEEISAELQSWRVAGLTLSDISLTGQRIHRDNPEISRTDREVSFLTLQLSGETGIRYGDQRKRALPGDLYLLDARRPFVLHSESFTRTLALTIPRHAFGGRPFAIDHFHGLLIPAADAVGSLIRENLRGIASADDDLTLPEQQDIADYLMTLIGHALSRRDMNLPGQNQGARPAQYVKACRIIERELRDCDFGPTRLARDAGVSLRHLQVIFAERGTSPMRVILERRIALARKVLLDRAYVNRTITQIAFECGFRDLTHFGRVFAGATGLTPRAWRRQNCGNGPDE